MSFLWSLVSFIIVIGVLISVHEYGHFWAARKCGIKVHRFSIGFGKVLWRRRDKQGTEFALSAIPLGGYVKMLDERNEEVPPELKSQAFNNKTLLQRAFVIIAGPLANFIFAALAYWAIYLVGIPSLKPVVAAVQENSVAARADIGADMQILAIDDSEVSDWESINMLLTTKIRQGEVSITLTPFGEQRRQQKILDLSHWTFDPDKESAISALGLVPVGAKVEMTLSKVAADSPAAAAGLQIGDKLYNQDGTEIQWQEFVNRVQQGNPIPLRVERSGEFFDLSLNPKRNAENRLVVGISPTFTPVADKYRTELKYDMLEAAQKAVDKTLQLSWVTVKIIGKLFSGDLSLNNLSGPISIAKGAGITSSIGIVYYLSFMALISVNLGIMNLFPLPVLDGGHLVFLAAEGIAGKPLSEKIQNLSYRIGAALLLALTALALFNDFLRL
ncbi:regulator of sigma E protease [Mesocricetibacter intestinalis]|uniref:Zinc metalloprotease n=1 Tax=Mesocricetibacter intestinalis TaxID=1521930 RepID=A0A4R6VFE4_9PAST|nr:sigma E protease regulator RseP [Mesocricetibacter intestinalis]TDQ59489.1 regulator of sigma E protease [Mesocricetibacter intestinalis]